MAEIRKIDLTCPSCGAEMQISEDQKMAVCPYCRKKLYFAMENGKLTAKEAEERSYGETRGKLRAEAEAEAAEERRKSFRKWKHRLIGIGIFVGLGLAAGLYGEAKKQRVDPFPYVTVEFSGVSGEGKAELKRGNYPASVNEYYLGYQVEPRERLSNGDTVTVQATSDRYRLTKSVEKYTVTGLDSYLSDLDSLDGTKLEMLHSTSLAAIRNTYFPNSISGIKRSEEISAKPVKLVLLSKGNKNVLSDIFEMTYRGPDGKEKTVYQCTRYRNVLFRSGNNTSFDYSTYMATGHSVYLGSTTNDDTASGYDTLEEAVADSRKTSESDMTVTERDE